MYYYEVLVADGHYHGNSSLTYSSELKIEMLSIVTVPLRQRNATGFVIAESKVAPAFKVKPIKSIVSKKPLPYHCLELAEWIKDYYVSTLAETLRQFAPTKPMVRKSKKETTTVLEPQSTMVEQLPLTAEQRSAIKFINDSPSTTVLLHGETGTGKTRVYIELAKKTLASGKSVIILTPEISLTSQVLANLKLDIKNKVFVLHSQLSAAERKRIWSAILESEEPVVVLGPRSALFSPLSSIGLVVVDEAHETAYKQDQAPYYQASRVASQLGKITGAKVVLGTATPLISDYYLASKKAAVFRMTKPAAGKPLEVKSDIIDIKDRSNFSRSAYLSNKLLDAISTTLSAKKQIIIYLNRRGSARLILCSACSWSFLCPNCDVALIYHGDEHLARCHICGFKQSPPVACPICSNPEIIYRSIGTKALADEVAKLFPNAKIRRFDSDNLAGEHLHEAYHDLIGEGVDILIGTQLLAKGLDLPRLALVGIVAAETSLALPDFTSEERSFQLLYQIIGRVGRGHTDGQVIVQSYAPDNIVVKSALARDWQAFYKHSLSERQAFRFPPFSYLLQLTCRLTTEKGAQSAAEKLKKELSLKGLAVEIIGPAPSFYARRGKYFYYQLVLKSKNRGDLVVLAKAVPQGWQVNIDPANLL